MELHHQAEAAVKIAAVIVRRRLTSGRMLSRHQADPRSETAARGELFPISYFGHQRGGDDRANTRDFLQPPAFFTRAVPGMDTLLDGHDLCPDSRILASKDVE